MPFTAIKDVTSFNCVPGDGTSSHDYVDYHFSFFVPQTFPAAAICTVMCCHVGQLNLGNECGTLML